MKRTRELEGPSAEQATRGRVLLVADPGEQRDRHGALARALRFDCLEAGGVRDALALADTRDPNLVFINLAEDGPAVAASHAMHRHFDGTVPILLALHPKAVPVQQRMAEAGADAYIHHPIDEVDLIYKLGTMMSFATRMQQVQGENVRLDALLRRHVGGPLVEHWLSQDTALGHEVMGRTVDVTVLFADLNGFTRMSSQWPAERTVRLLNEIMTICTLPLVDYGGTVDKYIGDCVMAYFGPTDVQADHPTLAVRAAVAMQKALGQWVHHHRHELADGMQVSIGLNTGQVVLGNMGSSLRLDHTVIGDPVNVASRLQELAPPGGIYAGALTAEHTADRFRWRSQGSQNVRGRVGPVEVFELADVIPTGC